MDNSTRAGEFFNEWLDAAYDWQLDFLNKISISDLNQDQIESCYDLYYRRAVLEESVDLDTKKIGIIFTPHSSNTVSRLNSIYNLKGIGAINSIFPLNFPNNLNIIYGSNGSGKSTYVNLLKNICKSRGYKPILGNVYSPTNPNPSADICYTCLEEEMSITWNEKISIKELYEIQIYDSYCADQYIKNQAANLYQPKTIFLLLQLINFSDGYKEFLNKKRQELVKKNPNIPKDLDSNELMIRYKTLDSIELIGKFKEEMVWADTDKIELDQCVKVLSESDPSRSIEDLKKQKAFIEKIKPKLHSFYDSISKENSLEIEEKKKDVKKYEELVKTTRSDAFKDSSLTGVGEEIWRELWDSAKKYSNDVAYVGHSFPYTDDGTRCVLCHQYLDGPARIRMKSFQEYLESAAELKLKKSHDEFETIIGGIPDLEEWSVLKPKMEYALLDAEYISRFETIYLKLLEKRVEMLDLEKIESQIPIIPSESLFLFFGEKIDKLDKELNAYIEVQTGRENFIIKKNSLECRKWIFENIDFSNLCSIQKISEVINKINTITITKKISQLSELLITQDFIAVFTEELKLLGAEKVKIKINKINATKGVVYHQVILDNPVNLVSANTVLSEGELRVASVAAFIADMRINRAGHPFIFDDPSCSLDSKYEEKIAQRIKSLSETNQVIIFTHRLPLINDILNCEPVDPEIGIVNLRKDSLGTPDPDSQYDYGSVSKSVNLLEDRGIKLKKCYAERDFKTHDSIARDLCSSFRVVIEKSIEEVLMADIVRRHEKNIYSTKIPQLKVIKDEDIDFIDSLMTKYSKYEHSQSKESDPEPIGDDELVKDIDDFKKWVNEVKARRNISTKSKLCPNIVGN